MNGESERLREEAQRLQEAAARREQAAAELRQRAAGLREEAAQLRAEAGKSVDRAAGKPGAGAEGGAARRGLRRLLGRRRGG